MAAISLLAILEGIILEIQEATILFILPHWMFLSIFSPRHSIVQTNQKIESTAGLFMNYQYLEIKIKVVFLTEMSE